MSLHFRNFALPFYFFLFINSSLVSQDYCEFDADIKKYYTSILNLDLDKVSKPLEYKIQEKKNLAYILLADEHDFYKLFINENKSEYLAIKANKNIRIELIDNSNVEIEWKRFLKAEILLHWALIHLKQEDEFSAFQSIRQSKQLLEENLKDKPDFIYTYKSLGILNALLSTIPESIQWAANLVGLQGNLYSGKTELEKFIKYAEAKQDMFIYEAYAIMSFVISYLENNPAKAYTYWTQKVKSPDNPLLCLIQVTLAMKANYNEQAITSLKSLSESQKNKLPYLYFQYGMCHLQKLDLTAADHFNNFLKLHPGTFSIKETYQKLAWISLIKGEKALYHLYISNCLTKGVAVTDEDKQAKHEAKTGKIPDLLLLKARLLCDGGDAKKAFNLLEPNKHQYYNNPDKRLEYAYRMGRICQLIEQNTCATNYFHDVFRFDPEFKSYMSANAMLQMGNILALDDKKSEAKKYYHQVLKLNPDLYKKSIHQKAKTALSRLQ